jgi:drug/metabolite transporter (DMT)-like permease
MDEPSDNHPPRLPALVAGFTAVYLLWGSTFLGIKFAVETIPPLLMAAGRFLLAGTALYGVLRLRGAAAPTAAQWRGGAVTGALLLLGGNGLVTWGQQTVPSGRAALIIATTPLWMLVLSWLFYGGGRPSGRVCLGLLVGFAGAALLVRPGSGGEGGSPAGLAALFLSPLLWSVGTLEARRNRPTEDALLTSALQMLTGGAMLLVAGTLLGEWPRLLAAGVSARSAAAFFYLSLLGGLVGFTTYAWLLRVASPAALSTYAYVNPLVAVLLGWLVAGEELGWGVLVPAGLVVGAVALITLPPARAAATPGAKADGGLSRLLWKTAQPWSRQPARPTNGPR